jgi:transposase
MIPFGSTQRYFLYCPATDMRKSFDGLCGLVRQGLAGDPLSGDVYIFVNGRRDRIKLLVWDRTGFVIYYKRLEQGAFELPAQKGPGAGVSISWPDLMLILEGISLASVRRRKRFSLPEKLKKSG